MKTAIKSVVAACLVFAAVSVSAQPHHGKGAPHRDRDLMLNKMKTELSLTDAQIVKIKSLDQETMQKMKAEKADKKAIMKNRIAQMQKILTPEQNTKWEAIKKQAMEERKARRESDQSKK